MRLFRVTDRGNAVDSVEVEDFEIRDQYTTVPITRKQMEVLQIPLDILFVDYFKFYDIGRSKEEAVSLYMARLKNEIGNLSAKIQELQEQKSELEEMLGRAERL